MNIRDVLLSLGHPGPLLEKHKIMRHRGSNSKKTDQVLRTCNVQVLCWNNFISTSQQSCPVGMRNVRGKDVSGLIWELSSII